MSIKVYIHNIIAHCLDQKEQIIIIIMFEINNKIIASDNKVIFVINNYCSKTVGYGGDKETW